MDDADITQERLEREQALKARFEQTPPPYGPEECDQCGGMKCQTSAGSMGSACASNVQRCASGNLSLGE